MMRSRHRIRCAGYTLIELMLVLILLTGFAATAGKLLVRTAIIQRDALYASNGIAQIDGLLRLMRSDVWAASAIHSDNPYRVTIHKPDGSAVRWEIRVRTLDDETESHVSRAELIDGNEIPISTLITRADLAFKAERSDLYLISGSDAVRMTSMHTLFSEAGP